MLYKLSTKVRLGDNCKLLIPHVGVFYANNFVISVRFDD